MEKERKEIRIFPDPILREKGEPITEIDGNIIALIEKMWRVMRTAKGIGLAANQIGINKRIIIAEVEDVKVTVINPLIIESYGEDRMEEGCLSIPNIYVEIVRPDRIAIKGLNRDGKEFEEEYSGLIARVIQHEIDHLQGTLIVDYLSPSEFIKFQRKYEKIIAGEEQ